MIEGSYPQIRRLDGGYPVLELHREPALEWCREESPLCRCAQEVRACQCDPAG